MSNRGPKSKSIGVRVDATLMQQIAEASRKLASETGIELDLSASVRALLQRGIKSVLGRRAKSNGAAGVRAGSAA